VSKVVFFNAKGVQMATELEREKTYLARYIPAQINGAQSEVIRDIYIPAEADHATIRLRRRGDKLELTKKEPVVGTDSSRQNEHTILLTQAEYNAFEPISNKELIKRRYYCTIYGHDAEIDIFQGKLAGLVMIDFEFPSDEAMASFEPLECCLADVTQDIVSAAGWLAGKSYQDIASQLADLGYQPLSLNQEGAL